MYTDEQLNKMSPGGRHAAYKEMADGASISEICAVAPNHRQPIVKMLKADPEARFKLKLGKAGEFALEDDGKGGKKQVNLKKGGLRSIRGANDATVDFTKGEEKEVSFRNAMHFFYTYGPNAPVAIHRDQIECCGRANAAVSGKDKQAAEVARAKTAAEKAKADAEKARAEAEAKDAEIEQLKAQLAAAQK